MHEFSKMRILAKKTFAFTIEVYGELQFSPIKGIKQARIVLFSIWCKLQFILDKTNQEKYGKIPLNYIVCQILPLEDAPGTPQYLKGYTYKSMPLPLETMESHDTGILSGS